jgi:hypothetical protein
VIEPRLFLCSGAHTTRGDPIEGGRKRVELDSIGNDANVNICFQNVAKVLERQLSSRLTDLLEIAAYVYAADCATERGKQWTDGHSKESWSRDFAFVIAVREPEFWASPEISSQLTELLTFLSNDKYSFTFVPLQHERPGQQQYFEFGDQENWPFHAPERVIMFSGGLDSLAGTVEMAMSGGELTLVSHRPVSTLSSRQRILFSELRKKFPRRLIHVPVWINKQEGLGREPTQRTRSFLYTALGTVVAELVQADGVRFFENGIVSLNFPVADEVIRARASRTTHPIALHLLQCICSKVTGRDFAVDNPYLFKTKTEVVASLATNQAAHLIPCTCSCAHSMFKSRTQWHCGNCSQCIDRRVAIIASGLSAHDPEADYVTDVFLGSRKDGPEKSMAADYARHGIELSLRSETELAVRFNTELSRAVRYEPRRSEAAEKVLAMHKRHGEVVNRVLKEQIAQHAEDLINGSLDDSSLLALVLRKRHLERSGRFVEATRQVGKGEAESDLERIATDSRILEQVFSSVLAKFEASKRRTRRKGKLLKRDAVIFAAILMRLTGTKYCAFIHEHEVKPKWCDSDSRGESYPKSYKTGDPWRKKVQDEKTRAKVRMDRYSDSELSAAFHIYLPARFDVLRQRLSTRTPLHQKARLPSV